jgi:hypothetical protein
MEEWKTAFDTRSDLTEYGENALALFALGLRFGLEDLESVAANAITAGSDDKKCDLVHVDNDDGYAVIVQCYFSSTPKKEAPANKASDLNTGVSWLLQQPMSELPERLKYAAEELRNGLNDGTVTDLHIWYVHNLDESTNVLRELKAVESTAQAALERHFSGKEIKVSAREVGISTLSTWYIDAQSPILVNDTFNIPIKGGYEIDESKWQSYVTAIPAQFIYSIYDKYKVRLFSANVRDYLGSRRSDANINNGIKTTADKEPHNFWVFNNGLTILVHDYKVN